MTKAIVPGTFDPITVGHLDVIERAAKIFDEVVVAVAASPDKNGTGPLFNVQERVELISTATKHFDKVSVKSFDNLLVTFAREENANVLVKGLRAITDFENEFQMAALNWKLASSIETLFIMASPDNMFLSSSAVREIARHGGSVSGLVPEGVEVALRSKFGHG
ncbi:MAG: pantetheine-phosphate adenylyltransferase [Actinomycetia bacterium]|nr:pantetheine-phosphate adenylyltransferase [Actinomycetes bacterium]